MAISTTLPAGYHEQNDKVRTIPKLVSVLPRSYHEATLNTLVSRVPEFLIRNGKRLTSEEARALNMPSLAWAPFRDHKNEPPKEPAALYVANDDLPVEVVVRTKGGNRTLARYDNMPAFRAAHRFQDYPVVRGVDTQEMTIVLVSAKPWAKDHDIVTTVSGQKLPKLAAKIMGVMVKAEPAKSSKAPGSRSKVQVIGDMLQQPNGCTRSDILLATGWPSVSVPAQARLAGLKLRTEKVKGQPTRYWGSK